MHTFYNLSQERFEVIMLELYVHRGRMGGGKQWWRRESKREWEYYFRVKNPLEDLSYKDF